MVLQRSAQLSHKTRILADALARIGGVKVEPGAIPIIAEESEYRYRRRLRLHLDSAGNIGLYARQSRRLVAIPGCIVCDVRIDEALAHLRQLAGRHPKALSGFDAVEIRCADTAPEVLVRLISAARPLRLRRSTREFLQELGTKYGVALDGGPTPEQRLKLPGGVELHAPANVFTQVNWEINRALVEHVVEGALARNVRHFCDVYAGAGNFTLPLLARGLHGVAIEHSQAAIHAAERAARAQGLSHCQFFAGDAESRLRELTASAERFDLLIADPPRSGARAIIPRVLELMPQHIALCSCDPATLARDVAEFLRARHYAVSQITAFDMFPQTHHVEAVLWLTRIADGEQTPARERST
jgi:23S rRNA (uracil1939-C5)-methyltransferase